MSPITLDDFQKLKIRVGKVLKVGRIPQTDKLYKLQVDLGEGKPRQIVTALAPYYHEKELLGKKIIVLTNLAPAKIAQEISEGMLLCAEDRKKNLCVLLSPEKNVPPGTPIT